MDTESPVDEKVKVQQTVQTPASKEDIFAVRIELTKMRGDVNMSNQKSEFLKESISSMTQTLHSINENMATKDDIKVKDMAIQQLQTKIDHNNTISETKLGQISESFTGKIGEVLLKIDSLGMRNGDALISTSRSIGKFDIISAIVIIIVSGLLGVAIGKVT